MGTFAPSRRASDKPMAIACLRLVTFLPERPLLRVPRLRSCIARSTFFEAFLLYLGIPFPFYIYREALRLPECTVLIIHLR